MIKLINYSVGQKIIVSLSGLFLVTFVIVHLLGNFLLFWGQDAFNTYAYLLTRNKAILYILEAGIIAGFLAHIILTIKLTWKNRKSRGEVAYFKKKKMGKSTIFSANMGIAGGYILLFLIIHIKSFKYGETPMVGINSFPDALVRDLYTLVVESFKDPLYSSFYCLGMLFLGGHLSHGFQSAFKSLGLYQTSWEKPLKRISVTLGILIGGGFMSIPLYFYFIG